jgi:hypothetical protein
MTPNNLAHNVNHSASFLVTYYIDEIGLPHFYCEKKSSDFRRFPGGIGFLGGNYLPAKHSDISAYKTLEREISEEFFLEIEPEKSEAIHFADGSTYLPASAATEVKFSDDEIAKTRTIGKLLLSNVKYGGAFVSTMSPPLSGAQPMTWSTFAFVRELDLSEYSIIKRLTADLRNVPTADNRKFGSSVDFYTLHDVKEKEFWHGEHDLVVNALCKSGVLPFSFGVNYGNPKAKHISFAELNIENFENTQLPSYESLARSRILHFNKSK